LTVHDPLDESHHSTHPGAVPSGACDELVIRTQPVAGDYRCVHKRLALASTILGSSMAFIDGSVVNVALSSIQNELGASVAAIQWVVNAYLLFLGSLVLIGGSMGDRFGRRNVFVAGIGLFTIASVACGLAPGSGTLIAARAIQGMGAALLIPNSLAIIGAVFDEKERGQAIGTWAGVAAIMSAVGPVAGGWLVDVLSWRAIFFINVPLACVTIALAIMSIPNSYRIDTRQPLDWPGALAAVTGLAMLTYGLTIASSRGLGSPVVLALIVAGVAALIAFVAIEIKSGNPMMPVDVFRSRDFVGVNVITLLLYFGLSGVLFFLPFTLIRAHHFTATEAGAALLPMPVVVGLLSRFAGALTNRIGPRAMLTTGPFVTAVGFILLGLLSTHDGYWSALFPALMAIGLGMTITVAPLTTTVMTSTTRDRIGVASGINNAVARVAGLLAVAVLGIVFVGVHNAALSTRLDQLSVPSDAYRRAGQLLEPENSATSSIGTARLAPQPLIVQAQADALDAALRAVALTCAACAFAGAVAAAVTIQAHNKPEVR